MLSKDEARRIAANIAPVIRPDADGERLKENPAVGGRRGVGSEK